MMRNIDFKIFNSYEEVRKDFEDAEFNQTPEERVSDIEFCRRQYFMLKGLKEDLRVKRILSICTREKRVG